MIHENRQKVEKLLDLENGISIWRVHLDALREQDKNARIMPLEKFERLTANMKKDSRLESLPLVTPVKNGHNEFAIISGHHRTRAARAAGIQFIHVMSINDELTNDQIVSKQLAHNALDGYDNNEVLSELYNEIQDINEKIASGLSDMDVKIEAPSIGNDDIAVGFDFEFLNIMFIEKQSKHFDEVLSLIEPEAKLYLADYKDFDRVKNTIQEISKRDDIRNIAAIMARMLDIVEKYHSDTPLPAPDELADRKQ